MEILGEFGGQIKNLEPFLKPTVASVTSRHCWGAARWGRLASGDKGHRLMNLAVVEQSELYTQDSLSVSPVLLISPRHVVNPLLCCLLQFDGLS